MDLILEIKKVIQILNIQLLQIINKIIYKYLVN